MLKTALVVQRRLTEYRVPLFQGMKDQLEGQGVGLRVVHGHSLGEEISRSDAGRLPWADVLPIRRYGLLGQSFYTMPGLGRASAGAGLVILPQENRFLSAMRLLRQPPRKACLWGHGENFQAGRVAKAAGFQRRRNALRAHWWFAYTNLSVERIQAHGFPRGRITCLNNAVDTGALTKWRKEIGQRESEELARSLNLKGARTGVFVGSLSTEKRLPFMFESAAALRARFPDFELVIVGDGPLREEVRAFAAANPWVRWVGTRHGREKVMHLSLGKVLLNPGMVGLGILDGFACGVPLVTTDCGIHSPEVAYLRPGVNGLMTANEVPAFVEGVASVLGSDELHDALVAEGKRDAAKYTLEAMVSNFCNGILAAMETPPLVS